MTEIQRETGTTFLLSTHDRELAERCERRIYIQGGVVVDVPSAARVPLRVVPGDMVAVIDRTQTQATRDQRSIQANERSV
jgi:ABC-type lipoprotein export system ATPase subunit